MRPEENCFSEQQAREISEDLTVNNTADEFEISFLLYEQEVLPEQFYAFRIEWIS